MCFKPYPHDIIIMLTFIIITYYTCTIPDSWKNTDKDTLDTTLTHITLGRNQKQLTITGPISPL